MNSKISGTLNIILLIAVAILYFLHFNSNTSSVNKESLDTTSTSSVQPSGLNLYYVNTDTISEKYEFAKELDQTLRNKRDQSERKFKSEVDRFQKEVSEFREKARFMTQEEGEKKQEELVIKEQELGRLEQDLSDQLLEDQQQLNRELRNRILSYIKKTGDARKISFVFGYSTIENNILLANDSLDLTKEILDGLNAEYNSGKKSE